MKPLLHPSVDDITVEGILHALSDPVRVAIFASIAQAEGPQTCSAFLACAGKSVPKSTLSQHFAVLRAAGLVRSERHGVEMRNSSRCREIEQRFPGLIPAIVHALRVQASRQDAAAGGRSGSGRKGRARG